MLTRNVLYYGEDRALPEAVLLEAGPLSLVLEQDRIRYVRLGEHEVLRSIYMAVRDVNWDTAPAAVSNRTTEQTGTGFRVRFDVENQLGPARFRWQATITGDQSGTLVFTMDGEAVTTFLRNRIGFCVLHPMRECAGRPCMLEKTSGAIERSAFPLHIAPHQPFLDLAAISHEVVPGVVAEVRFSGDVFETEDQRNWSDASFKTYSTPLALPMPVEIRAGTRVKQSITLSLRGQASRSKVRRSGHGSVAFSFSAHERQALPAIGLGSASHGGALDASEIARLKTLHLSHLRVDLPMANAQWAPRFERAASEARALGVALEAAVILSDAGEEELARLAARASDLKARVVRWLIFHADEKSTPAKWVVLARKLLPGGKFVAGSNAYFTELNRERPDVSVLDGACFSVNPQVHAFDNQTLVENLATQAEVVESARQFLGRVPVSVTPVTLKPRFNPAAGGNAGDGEDEQREPSADPRQMSLLGAGWTAGSLKYLAAGGAASVTYYETTGRRGVMETAAGSPPDTGFHSIPGGVFPLYHVLADAGEFRGGEALACASSDPLALDGLVLRHGDRTRILIANFRPERAIVMLSAADVGRRVVLKMLDESNAERAMTAPEEYRAEAGKPIEVTGHWLELSLPPYAVARLDAGKETK